MLRFCISRILAITGFVNFYGRSRAHKWDLIRSRCGLASFPGQALFVWEGPGYEARCGRTGRGLERQEERKKSYW